MGNRRQDERLKKKKVDGCTLAFFKIVSNFVLA